MSILCNLNNNKFSHLVYQYISSPKKKKVYQYINFLLTRMKIWYFVWEINLNLKNGNGLARLSRCENWSINLEFGIMIRSLTWVLHICIRCRKCYQSPHINFLFYVPFNIIVGHLYFTHLFSRNIFFRSFKTFQPLILCPNRNSTN